MSCAIILRDFERVGTLFAKKYFESCCPHLYILLLIDINNSFQNNNILRKGVVIDIYQFPEAYPVTTDAPSTGSDPKLASP